jgi:hypothetical protein
MRADLKTIKNQMDFWIQRLSNTGGLPSDNQDFQLRKAVLILLAGTCTVLGIIWGLAYFALGFSGAGIIPLGYSAVSAISLFYFFRSKKYKLFCRGQLTLILILPFLLQWNLGGFAASGAVILWSLLAPIGALMFAGTNRAVPWFLVYAFLVIISSMIGGKPASQPILPPTAVMTSFLMNISGVSAIVFFLLRYFGRGRDEAMAALDKEHRRVQHSLSLAMEVQQNLLPNTDPKIGGLDISGKSTYCDETGGDYYDFLEDRNCRRRRIRPRYSLSLTHGHGQSPHPATLFRLRQYRSCSGGCEPQAGSGRKRIGSFHDPILCRNRSAAKHRPLGQCRT